MHNGLQRVFSLALGQRLFGLRFREPTTSFSVSRGVLARSDFIAGTIEPSVKVLTLQQQQTEVGQVRLSLFNPCSNEAATTEEVTTMSSNIFADLASLAASDVFPPVLTLVNSTLADIEANPQEWINPASATVKGTAFVANLIATLPAIENAAVPAAAQLVSAVLSTLSAKLTAVSAVTPASVGAEIGNTIISKT
jgi:hypothetical protein